MNPYCLIFVVSLFSCAVSEDERKPIYIIAHMVNSIAEVDQYLNEGANAIETDISFVANGTATHTFHGYPCDCFRICDLSEKIDKFLKYIADITTEGHPKYKKHFILIQLDLKLTNLKQNVKLKAGENFAKLLLKYLFHDGKSKSKINVQISVNHVEDADFIVGFNKLIKEQNLTHLKKRIGWDVSFNDPLPSITEMWIKVDKISQIWQGDGITNCLSPFRKTRRLRQALTLNSHCDPKIHKHCIRKVYQWTVDLPSKLRSSLRLGVDGIITNKPKRLHNILKEKEFSKKYKLADKFDGPWDKE